MKFSYVFIAVMLLSHLALRPAIGDGIYRWMDENGHEIYTSEKPAPSSKPVDLPEIMRGEVKLAPEGYNSCNNHGGINCQAGADTDGSVICYDGFSEATARFLFNCSSPKLELSEIRQPDPAKSSFEVVVRNSRSVEAKNPKVTFALRVGEEYDIPGPEVIDPFGVAVFRFRSTEKLKFAKVRESQIQLDCDNCSGR